LCLENKLALFEMVLKQIPINKRYNTMKIQYSIYEEEERSKFPQNKIESQHNSARLLQTYKIAAQTYEITDIVKILLHINDFRPNVFMLSSRLINVKIVNPEIGIRKKQKSNQGIYFALNSQVFYKGEK
jgi:hypothetical protein